MHLHPIFLHAGIRQVSFFFLLSSFVFYLGLFFLADLSRDECDKGAKIDYAGSFYFLNIYGCLNHIYLPNDRYESKHQHPTFQRFVGMNPILGWAWIFLSQNLSRWAILGQRELKIIITASAIDFADDISTLMKKKKRERDKETI